jgi:RimJ/RimL family protein N-acetyltransferase
VNAGFFWAGVRYATQKRARVSTRHEPIKQITPDARHMSIVITPIAAEHVEGFHRALDIVARERKYLAFLEAPPLAATRQFISDNIAKGHAQFVAVADGEVVGWCDVLPRGQPVHAHVGVLGMGLIRQFRGRGHGTALIDAALRSAKQRGMIRIQLSVHADNAPAIRLYEKVGFKTEGTLRDAVLIDGQFKDLIVMGRLDR